MLVNGGHLDFSDEGPKYKPNRSRATKWFKIRGKCWNKRTNRDVIAQEILNDVKIKFWKQNIRSNDAGLFLKFVENYRVQEMRNALRTLRMWEAEHGAGFVEKFRERIKKGDPKADAVDEARRHVKGYFIDSALGSYELGSVTLPFLQKVTAFAGINILYDIVEPLEQAINPNYDKSKFERLRQLCGRFGSGELLTPIPVVHRPVEPTTEKEDSKKKTRTR